MRLFRRGRTRRAAATVRSIEVTDRLDKLCEIDVLPDLAPRFPSTLRTRLEIVPGAETFVRFDPDDTEECELDVERLRPCLEQGRAYTRVLPAETRRGRVSLADARQRLEALDRLSDLRERGMLSEDDFAAERERVLSRPA